VNGKLAALIAVADPVKPASRDAIAALHDRGFQVAMITGDKQETAEAIARETGIDQVIAGVLPDGKVAALDDLRAGGRKIAFVGGACRCGHRDRHGHGRGDRVRRCGADVRRSARRGERGRGVEADDVEYPPEPGLGVRLQRGLDPGCCRCALSRLRVAAVSGFRRGRDGAVLGFGPDQCAAAAPYCPRDERNAKDWDATHAGPDPTGRIGD